MREPRLDIFGLGRLRDLVTHCRSMCPKIATAAGVASAYVSCSVAAVAAERRRLLNKKPTVALADAADEADRHAYESSRRRLDATGVVITATIQASGTDVTGASVVTALATTMGTAEQVATALAPDDGSYTLTVSTPPTASATDSTGAITAGGSPSPPPPPAAPPSAPPPTSPTVTIIIIAAGAVVALLVVGIILKMTVFKAKPAAASKGSA